MSEISEEDSFLKLYSLGIVIEDKEKDSNIIKFSPIEKLRLSKGKIADQKYEYNESIKDAKGVTKTKTVTGSDALEAKWFPFANSNRLNAPDVRKNETVAIFRFADTDEYHWTTIFNEPEIRRLETIVIGACNLKEGLKPFDKESAYYLEISTEENFIQLKTTKSNNESFEYSFKIDTNDSTVEINDDIGNSIKLDSKNNKVSIITLESIDLTTKDVNIDCDNYNIKCQNYNVQASQGSTMDSSGSISMKSASEIKLDSPLVTNTGNEVTEGTSTANPHLNCVC